MRILSATSAMDAELAARFIALMFEARNKAHFAHLKTRSFALHKALNEFYDGIIPLADSFAETWQGYTDIIENYPTVKLSNEPEKFLVELESFIASERNDMTSRSDLQNIIDEIVSLIQSTKYKLKLS